MIHMVLSLEVQGRTYIAVHDAAREAEVSESYIARLARKGSFGGSIIAGMWFVDHEQLRSYMAGRSKKKQN